ncbi:hypothetical protein IW262DRAFT_1302482 [Armillaria fumosa]|nr:hypothetical protein IW262DRAFT_1302482 [Armillaria fumosa]
MPAGSDGSKYVVQAIERTILWPKAKTMKKQTSKAVVRFIYEDIISYHPQGMAPVEHHHQMIVDPIFKCTGDAKGLWARFLFAVLFALHVTVSRATGFAPYYLLYGVQPVFSFDVTEITWQTLNWHEVKTHEELITIRALQITRRDEKLREANERLRETRRRAIEDLAKRAHFKFGFMDYEEESQLDEIKGGKDSRFDLRTLDNNPVGGFHQLDDLKKGNPFATYPRVKQHDFNMICSLFVDDGEYCSVFKGDLTLRYEYDVPMEFVLGDEVVTLPVVVRVYRRDRALKWNEIWTQLKHWGTYPPARYCIPPVECEHLYVQQYPWHTKWFRRMGTGLRVSTDPTDFEFKALLVYDPRDVALQYDAVSLASRIQNEMQAWHINAVP